MKKMFTTVVVLCVVCVAFAGPRHHGRPCGPGFGPGPRGNDGVWLAAGITSIVANGLNIVTTLATPRVVTTTPAVTEVVVPNQPVVVPQPVYPAQQQIVVPQQYQYPVVVPRQPIVVPQTYPVITPYVAQPPVVRPQIIYYGGRRYHTLMY